MAELDGKQVGTVQQDVVNKTGHQNSQSHNLFDLSHYNALTARFADLTPFLCKEVVPGDNVRFGSNHELRTLTLSAPVLSPVRMHKDYFFVPMKSILPHWDDIISNQLNNMGFITSPDQHLPRFNIYSLYKEVLNTLAAQCYNWCGYLGNMSAVPVQFFQLLVLARNMFSRGGLLRMLQYPTIPAYTFTSSTVEYVNGKNLEQLIDTFWQYAADKDKYTPYSESDTYVKYLDLKITSVSQPEAMAHFSVFNAPLHGNGTGSVGRFLDILEMCNFDSIQSDYAFVNDSDELKFSTELLAILSAIYSLASSTASAISSLASATYDSAPEAYVNFSKLAAYHAIAVQFFTNDKVDDITNIREYLQTYWHAYGEGDGTNFSRYDGPTYTCLNALTNNIKSSVFGQSGFNYREFYMLIRMLCFDNALKYGDYFIGAKPQPISSGDVSITVNAGKVAAIDVTKNLLVQKLLNAINKLGSSISEYSKGIMGEAPKFVDATPQFLARSTTYIGNPETTNTADDQGKITSQFRSVDGKFEFSASFSDFGYIVGLVSFDVLPCYPSRVDRDAYHTDFYTFFNPMLQNIGDQPVMLNEVDPTPANVGREFGYQQRFAEYKSMASYCSGAFAKEGRSSDYYGLQSWLFQVPDINYPISPYVIRHHRSDFDRFYSSFDGLNLTDYAHFAIIFNNDLKINRKMQFQSTLL